MSTLGGFPFVFVNLVLMNLLLSILEGFNLCPLNVGLCFITTKKVKLHFLQENDKGPSLKPDFVSPLGGFPFIL